jgi:hypothetical protein
MLMRSWGAVEDSSLIGDHHPLANPEAFGVDEGIS